jgi:phosphoglycolate phosphatase
VNTSSSVPWLIVDVDDTLVDTCTIGWRKCVESAKRLGLPEPSRRLFGDLYGSMMFDECVRRLHPGIDVAAYSAVYDGLADWAPAEPIGSVRCALESASVAGFRIGVLTNGSEAKTRRKLGCIGLTEADFEFVCHAGNSLAPKPDVEAFLRLKRDFGILPARAWYASDQGADWRAAVQVGFGAIGIVTGRVRTRPAGEVPHLLASRLDAMAGCLPQLASMDRGVSLAPIRHVGLDAGFTLIEHVSSPAQLLAEEFSVNNLAVNEAEASDAFGALLSRGWSDRDTWGSDDRIEAALRRLYRAVTDTLVDRLPNAVADHATRDRIASAVVRGYGEPENWRPRFGVEAALRQFRATGKTVGVLSNWRSDLPEVLAATGLVPLIDTVCPSAACGFAKPNPKAWGVLLDELDVGDPSSMIFCGDDIDVDVGGALLSGCRAVLIDAPWDSDAMQEVVKVVVS